MNESATQQIYFGKVSKLKRIFNKYLQQNIVRC